jgi:hypothetical protein
MKLFISRLFCLVSLVLVLASCGGVKQAPPAEPVKSAPETQASIPPAPSAQPPSAVSPPSASQSSAAPSASTVAAAPATTQPAERPSAPPTPSSKSAPKDIAPSAKAPAKAAAPAAPTAKIEAPPPAAVKPSAAPPLDLSSLEKRLKETSAIGVMTKLTLKNQVDDLLNQFRAFYAGKLKTTLTELRRPYDLLILKVLSLLQDKDPPLASDLAASRDAIWAILSDPVKFAAMS